MILRRPQLTLTRRLVWSVLVMVVPLAVVVGVAWAGFSEALGEFAAASDEATEEAIPITMLQAQMGDYSAVSYEAATQDSRVGRRALAAARFEIDAAFSRLFDVEDLVEEREDVEDAYVAWQQADDVVAEVLAIPPAERVPAGLVRLDAEFNPLVRQAGASLRAAAMRSEGDLRSKLAEAERDRDRALVLMAAISTAAVLIGLIVSRRLARSVTAPLAELREGARRVGAGDLDHRLDSGRRDELGEVADAFDVMAANLKRAQGDLVHQAFHDPLTGLANRTLLRDRIDHALGSARRRQQPLAVLMLDLDEFKRVNDSLGHDAGDQVLLAASERVSSCLRPDDTAARLGGDEFAVLLEDLDSPETAMLVADRLLASLAKPFDVSGTPAFLGGSIGVVVSDDAGEGPDELLRNADLAMYRAKQLGRGRVERFEHAMHDVVVERLGLEAELRMALERDELVLHFQPIVDLKTGAIVDVEALSRWQHPERGLLPPDEFIPLAVRTGLDVPLGWWVVRSACEQLRLWQRYVPSAAGIGVSVNLSPHSLLHPELIPQLTGALERTRLAPSLLTLEITENVMMHEGEGTLERLRQLHAIGVRIAIDDFGTGYSSFSYLRRFALDRLKVDKSFVDHVETKEGAAVVGAILGVSRSLSLQPIAEGIEGPGQRDVLIGLDCELGQGNLFGASMTVEEMTERLAEEHESGRATASRVVTR